MPAEYALLPTERSSEPNKSQSYAPGLTIQVRDEA